MKLQLSEVMLLQMLTFLEKNTKDRSRARVGALASGSKTSAIAAAEAVLDSVPASGTMTQLEVNEVSMCYMYKYFIVTSQTGLFNKTSSCTFSYTGILLAFVQD